MVSVSFTVDGKQVGFNEALFVSKGFIIAKLGRKDFGLFARDGPQDPERALKACRLKETPSKGVYQGVVYKRLEPLD